MAMCMAQVGTTIKLMGAVETHRAIFCLYCKLQLNQEIAYMTDKLLSLDEVLQNAG